MSPHDLVLLAVFNEPKQHRDQAVSEIDSLRLFNTIFLGLICNKSVLMDVLTEYSMGLKTTLLQWAWSVQGEAFLSGSTLVSRGAGLVVQPSTLQRQTIFRPRMSLALCVEGRPPKWDENPSLAKDPPFSLTTTAIRHHEAGTLAFIFMPGMECSQSDDARPGALAAKTKIFIPAPFPPRFPRHPRWSHSIIIVLCVPQ